VNCFSGCRLLFNACRLGVMLGTLRSCRAPANALSTLDLEHPCRRAVLLRPCRKATVGKLQVALGDVVQLFDDDDSVVESADDDVTLGLVQAMWQSSSGVHRKLLC